MLLAQAHWSRSFGDFRPHMTAIRPRKVVSQQPMAYPWPNIALLPANREVLICITDIDEPHVYQLTKFYAYIIFEISPKLMNVFKYSTKC